MTRPGSTVGEEALPARAAPFDGPRMLLVAAVGIFLVGPAQTSGVAPFVEPLLATFGWPRSVISTAYALGTLAGAGGVVVSGRLLDRYGQGRVLTGAALAFAAALLAASAIRDPLTLTLGFALLRGAGIGAVLLGSRTLNSQWYVRRRGWALSLGAVAGALSAALFPALAVALIARIGWRAGSVRTQDAVAKFGTSRAESGGWHGETGDLAGLNTSGGPYFLTTWGRSSQPRWH